MSTPEPWAWPTQASSAWAFPSAHQQGATPTNQGSFLFSGFPLSSFNNFHASGSSHLSGPTTSQSMEPTNGSVYLGQALRPWSGPTGFNNAPNPVIPLERPFVPKGFRNEVGITEVMESIGAIEPYSKFSHEVCLVRCTCVRSQSDYGYRNFVTIIIRVGSRESVWSLMMHE